MAHDNIGKQELEQKRHDWKAHITNWKASRLSQTEYCRRHELKFHQFVYWRRKFAPKPPTPISNCIGVGPQQLTDIG